MTERRENQKPKRDANKRLDKTHKKKEIKEKVINEKVISYTKINILSNKTNWKRRKI